MTPTTSPSVTPSDTPLNGPSQRPTEQGMTSYAPSTSPIYAYSYISATSKGVILTTEELVMNVKGESREWLGHPLIFSQGMTRESNEIYTT